MFIWAENFREHWNWTFISFFPEKKKLFGLMEVHISAISETNENMYLVVSVYDRFPVEFVFIYNISLMYKYLLELTKRRSKVQEKNTSRECALNFDHWKTFLRNYEPIRVWLWLVYKFTENNCHLQKPLENLKTIYHIHPKFSLWTKLPILLAKYLIFVAATLIALT